MSEPKGYILVPVGFNPDGDLRSLELTADDFLRVNVEGGTLTVAKHNILDGDVHGDSVAKAVTRGGVLVGSSAPAWDRLDLGADNAVLASDGSDLAYETLASLLKAAVLTSNGDILIRDNSGNVTRLAKGANGEVLTLAGGAASWAAATGGYTEGCRAYNSGNTLIASGSTSYLDLDSERYDTDSIHDPGTNPDRLTCKTAGKYVISGSCEYAAHSTGVRQTSIQLNGTTFIVQDIRFPIGAGDGATRVAVATIYELSVNDYVRLGAYQTSGGNLNIVASGNQSPELAMQRIG